MAAMMPAASGGNQSSNPYAHYDNPVDDDLIDPDDGIHSPSHFRGRYVDSLL